jgi:hypothetical protein
LSQQTTGAPWRINNSTSEENNNKGILMTLLYWIMFEPSPLDNVNKSFRVMALKYRYQISIAPEGSLSRLRFFPTSNRP